MFQLPFEKDNNKKYKVKVIHDNVIYIQKLESGY